MPSNPDSQFAWRDNDLAIFYNKNFGNSPSPLGARSQATKRDIQRYRWLLELSLPKFAPDDAVAIFAALNGCNTSHSETLEALQQGVASEIGESLGNKIRALSLAQWLAIVDACDRVGAGEYFVQDLDSELRRVGLT